MFNDSVLVNMVNLHNKHGRNSFKLLKIRHTYLRHPFIGTKTKLRKQKLQGTAYDKRCQSRIYKRLSRSISLAVLNTTLVYAKFGTPSWNPTLFCSVLHIIMFLRKFKCLMRGSDIPFHVLSRISFHVPRTTLLARNTLHP